MRCGQIVRDSRAAFLLTTSGLLESVRSAIGDSNLRSVVLLDDAATTTAQPFKSGAWPNLGDLPIVNFRGESQDLRILPNNLQSIENDTACIYYTSGSTGAPKGVMMSHRGTLAAAESGADAFGLVPSDRFGFQAPLHFAPLLSASLVPAGQERHWCSSLSEAKCSQARLQSLSKARE